MTSHVTGSRLRRSSLGTPEGIEETRICVLVCKSDIKINRSDNNILLERLLRSGLDIQCAPGAVKIRIVLT